MFKKPSTKYADIVSELSLDESDFIDLNTFMKHPRYQNTDEEQKNKLIKQTLDEAIKTRKAQIKNQKNQ